MPSEEAKYYSQFGSQKYNELFPEVNVLYEYDCFIPCHSYRVMIPVRKKDNAELNIFEMTVLRLLANFEMTLKEISETMCCHLDFITFVVNSLIERAYLDQDMHLTDISKSILQRYCDEDSKEYINVRMFCLKGTTEPLSLICLNEDEIRNARILDNKIEITYGSNAGEEKHRTYPRWKIRSSKGNNKLTEREIKKAIRDYVCIIESYGGVSGVDFIKGSVNSESARDVFLHIKAIVQRGNIDSIIVSDGLLMNNSLLSNYMEENTNHNFLNKVKTNAASFINRSNRANKAVINNKYPELEKCMNNIKIFKEVKNVDDIAVLKTTHNRSINYLNGALEWCMHYYLQNSQLQPVIKKIYLNQNKYENYDLTKSYADKIGLSLKNFPDVLTNFYKDNMLESHEKTDENLSEIHFLMLLLQTDGIKLQNYFTAKEKVPSIELLLPLCIAEAANNTNSRFRKLMTKFPHLIDGSSKLPQVQYYEENECDLSSIPFSIGALKNQANKSRHSSVDIDTNIILAWKDKIASIVNILLPDYQLVGDSVKEQDIDSSLEKINALVSLSKIINNVTIQKLPYDLKQSLFTIAPSNDNIIIPPNEFVLVLSKILEYAFKNAYAIADVKESNILSKEKAIEYIEKITGTELPYGLKLINDNYYKSAVAHRNATLGAYCLAWAGNVKQSVIEGEKLTRLLELVNTIARLRGHGNNVSLSVDEEQLKAMRLDVCNAVEMLDR